MSLFLFGSDSFAFILIWSDYVYLWMNLSNYPNIFEHVSQSLCVQCTGHKLRPNAWTVDYSCFTPQVANFDISVAGSNLCSTLFFFFFLIIKSAVGSYLVSMLFLLHSHARLVYTLPQISYPKKKKKERERKEERELTDSKERL